MGFLKSDLCELGCTALELFMIVEAYKPHKNKRINQQSRSELPELQDERKINLINNK